MNTLTIYKRTILERTGFKKYPYKDVEQVSIFYGKQEFKNHDEKIDNPRLKVKFEKKFETRSKKDVENYISKLGRTDVDKWIKYQLNELLKEKK